jgi:hypothetical protein
MRNLGLLLSLMALLLVSASAQAQDDRVFIDHIDISKYAKDGRLRFYLDVLDGRNQVIKDQEKDKIKLFFNDEPIGEDWLEKIELSQFRKIEEPMAIGILLTNYRGFLARNSGEINLFKYVKNGITDFLGGLQSDFDWVGVWVYNEEALSKPHPFSTDVNGAVSAVRNISAKATGTADVGEEKTRVPDFYRYLGRVITQMDEQDDLPRRRILLIVSDGLGKENLKKQRRLIDDRLKRTVEAANDANIKVIALGAYLQEDLYLPFLKRLASDTHGLFEQIDDPEQVEIRLQKLAPQLNKQYVVDFFAPGLPDGKKLTFRVEVETPKGRKKSAVYHSPLKLPETPTNWGAIFKWIGIVLASILGLFLGIWVVRRWLARRSERASQEYYEPVQEEYTGPDRGKLHARSGPLAGDIFHLTDDVITIGAIDGNDIVIADEGVSKRHAGIKIEDMRYELADFGSTNGTWVNGRKINKQFLKDGDEIRIGNTELEFTLK